MIQRIQSLFLLLTGIATGLLFFLPVATIDLPDEITEITNTFYFYTTRYIRQGNPPTFIEYNWFSMILNITVTGLSFITIFLYKKRFLQLRLCLANIVLMAGMLILIAVQAHNIAEPDGYWHICLSFSFPLVGIILTWLALRGIIKDIALLKSYDRIR